MQDGDLATRLRSIGIEVYATGFLKLRFQVPTIASLRLARLVRDTDIIHILGYWNLLSIVTSRLAERYVRPYVFCAAGEFARLEKPRPIDRVFHKCFGQRMLKSASLFLAITPLEQTQIISRFGKRENSVVVIPNGVEYPNKKQNISRFPLPESFILFLGRLSFVKGPDLLLEAFARIAANYPSVNLVIAGPDFGMLRDLKEMVHAQGLKTRVLFPGHLSDVQKYSAYHQSLFLVVPSRAEAMSLVALEAAIAGTPVLLTDQCGFDEIETVGGGKVVPATIEGVMIGLHSMLERRIHLHKDGERLKTFVSQHYTWPKIVARLREHLNAIIMTCR